MNSNMRSYFQVEAKLPGPHTNMRLEQKVRLGHIPPRSIGKYCLSLSLQDQIEQYTTIIFLGSFRRHLFYLKLFFRSSSS